MHDDDQRLTRLRDLAARLARLPESPDRDRMLSEVRARIVDVDTGFPPRPLRPMHESEPAPAPAPAPAAARPAKRRAAPRPQPARIERVEPREAQPSQETPPAGDAPIVLEPVLWLEDAETPEGTESSELPGWRRGLRG